MDSEPVTVTAAYRVDPGQESEFYAWAIAMLNVTARLPGYLGGGVLGSGQGSPGAVFPPVLIFNVLVISFLGDTNFLLRTLALCRGVTAMVTWLVMPRLHMLLKKWLYPPLQSIRGRHKRVAANGPRSRR